MTAPAQDDIDMFVKAAGNGDADAVRSFIDRYPACVDLLSKWGMCALVDAAWNGEVKIVEFLLSRGANIDIVNNDGHTPLMAAAIGGEASVARLLLERGARADLHDKRGRTARMLAEEWHNAAVLDMIDTYVTVSEANAKAAAHAKVIEDALRRRKSTPSFGKGPKK